VNLSGNLLHCLLSFKHDETVSYRGVSLVYVSNGVLVNWELGKGSQESTQHHIKTNISIPYTQKHIADRQMHWANN